MSNNESDARPGHLHARGPGLAMPADEFRRAGRELVDEIAAFLAGVRERNVAPPGPRTATFDRLGLPPLPEHGRPAEELLREARELLLEHGLISHHPRSMAYVLGGLSHIGVLGDFLAAAHNPTVSTWTVAPVAQAIELQTIQWLVELLGLPEGTRGVMTSGGSMACTSGLAIGREARVPWSFKEHGMCHPDARRLRLYATRETHGWLMGAVDLLGLGRSSIRWVDMDAQQRMDVAHLRALLREDRQQACIPWAVVGNAGTTSTGAVDPLSEIGAICRGEGLWFQVDGAYGGVALLSPDAPPELQGLRQADCVCVDPHKWLYAPYEAGCLLFRDPRDAVRAFRCDGAYYTPVESTDFSHPHALRFRDLCPQSSRGFKALKVWLALQHVGRAGYQRMISEDIRLVQEFHERLHSAPEIEPMAQGLSVSVFRLVPEALRADPGAHRDHLDRLNQAIVARLHAEGRIFPSHTVVDGRFGIRICVLNYQTTRDDLDELLAEVLRCGHELDRDMRSAAR